MLNLLQRVQFRWLGLERKIQARQGKVVAQGPFMAVRRKALTEEMLKKYLASPRKPGDDLDLSLLLVEDGWQSLRAPEAVATTHPKRIWKGYITQQIRWHRSFYREFSRIKQQHTGQGFLLGLMFWLRAVPVGPCRLYALLTRNNQTWERS
jgi:cellulose synthase/poly-beta-1,6-N-acetylglucosamine synthase-like glycosyltransferase